MVIIPLSNTYRENIMNSTETWLRQHTPIIEAGFENFIAGLKSQGNFYRGNLPLSDLRICSALKAGDVPVPPGHRVILSSKITGSGVRKESFHFCAYDGKTVVDMVVGQFLTDEFSNISGTAILLERAPQLFYVLSDKLVALHATFDEIKSELGLTYHF